MTYSHEAGGILRLAAAALRANNYALRKYLQQRLNQSRRRVREDWIARGLGITLHVGDGNAHRASDESGPGLMIPQPPTPNPYEFPDTASTMIT
ncbi:MAG: hypothetical protein ABI779_07685, partial [Acidobacteriota bacterium]